MCLYTDTGISINIGAIRKCVSNNLDLKYLALKNSLSTMFHLHRVLWFYNKDRHVHGMGLSENTACRSVNKFSFVYTCIKSIGKKWFIGTPLVCNCIFFY